MISSAQLLRAKGASDPVLGSGSCGDNLTWTLDEEGVLTVSCAGGMDFNAKATAETKATDGTALKLIVKGLTGGHSGVEIDKGRVNSNVLAGRFLNALKKCVESENPQASAV